MLYILLWIFNKVTQFLTQVLSDFSRFQVKICTEVNALVHNIIATISFTVFYNVIYILYTTIAEW